jgi:hypothetical protein
LEERSQPKNEKNSGHVDFTLRFAIMHHAAALKTLDYGD